MSTEGGVGFCEIGLQAEGRPGPETTTRHIALCVDVSGSMAGDPLEHAKEGARTALEFLQPNDYLSVISFSGNAEVVVDTVRFGDANKRRLKEDINQLSVGSWTNIEDGLRTARRSLPNRGGRETVAKRIILLSDGGANRGIDSASGLADIASEFREEDGISIIAAGLDTDYDEEVVRRVAEASDGRWEHITDPNNIKQFFNDAFYDAGTVLASAPEVEIDLNGVEMGEIYRRRPQVKKVDIDPGGQVQTISLPDLRERELQELVFQVHIPPGEEGMQRTVFDATLNSGGRVVDSDRVSVEYTNYPDDFVEHESIRAKFIDARGIYESIQDNTQRASELFERAQGTVRNPNAQNILDQGQQDSRTIQQANGVNDHRQSKEIASSNRPTEMRDLPDRPERKGAGNQQAPGGRRQRGRGGQRGRWDDRT